MAIAIQPHWHIWVVRGGRGSGVCVPEEQTIFRWTPVVDWSRHLPNALQGSLRKMDRLLEELGHAIGGPLHAKRYAIADEFMAEGINSALVGGAHLSVLTQLETRLKRKDLSAMISRVATEACDTFAVFDESAEHLNRRFAKKPIDQDLAARLRDAVERDRLAGKPAPVEWLQRRLRDVYAEDSRKPLHPEPPEGALNVPTSEEQDLIHLRAAFWANGRPRPIVRPAKRPRHVFWQVYPADIVDSLTTGEVVKPSVAIRLTSALLLTTLVESGAFPPSFGRTFSETGIKKSLQRKPPREVVAKRP